MVDIERKSQVKKTPNLSSAHQHVHCCLSCRPKSSKGKILIDTAYLCHWSSERWIQLESRQKGQVDI